MSKRIFTKEQIENLLKNQNIEKCSERSITYSKRFKTQSVGMYDRGTSSTEIFRQAGFDLNVIGRNQPKDCLRRWRKIIRKKGSVGLSEARGGKGGRPKKIQDKTDADKIKRLEATVAYLEAENDFLAKLRAKRAE